MKKFILLSIFCFLCMTSRAFAGFDFGATTYETADDILVVNSLGDQPVVSQYGTLGTNDWIPENAVKNYLKLDGYTVAYDYNPTAAHDWGVYNQALPNGGAGLTQLKFAGLLGDPRTEQSVYVLTSEYNRLSAAGQANSIDNINTSITNINTVNSQQTTDINTLNSQVTNINTVNNQQTTQINTLTNVTNQHTADINTLTNVTNTHTTEIQNLNNSVNYVNQVNDRQEQEITSTNQRVDDVSNRVSKLEKTQAVVGLEGRIYDSRKWQVNTFVDYTTTRNTVDRVGVRFTYKFGKSYEEKRLDELQARLDKLEGIKNVQEQAAHSQVYPTQNGFGIRSNF